MKSIFLTLFLAAAAVFLSNCSNSTAANNGNANTIAASPTAETNTNANATAQETPLPVFTDAETALAEGIKLLDENKTEKAIEALRQAVKLNPDLADAHFRLGVAYGLLEVEEKASEETELTGTPTPTPTGSKKGKNAEPPKTDSEKAFENAVKAYKKILAKEPKNDAAQYNLGRAYNKLNQDKEAEKSLRQAVKLKPDDTEYQTELGAILMKLAQYDESIKVLKKALELDSSNLQAEELLEKAEAGKKRVDFGAKQKSSGQPQQTQPNAPRQTKPKSSSENEQPTGAPPPTSAPKPNPPAPPKMDKKGNQ